VSVSVPQFPHASCLGVFGVQTGVLAQEHAPHAQEPVHVAVPYVLHGSVEPLAQVPCPVQAPGLPHEQAAVQVYVSVPQSPQATCFVAPGEHAPVQAAHLPAVHVSELQSPFAPHAPPTLQLGEHVGAEHLLAVQTPEPQSALAPHAAPSLQVGEQEGGAQRPFVQMPDAQSVPAPHADPSAQVGAHVGAAHLLFVHTIVAQSPFAEQV
jgi:hypothetical protein